MRGPTAGLRTHVVWLAVSLVLAGGMLYVLLNASGSLPSVSDTYRAKAIVPTAVSLAPGATVRVAGLRVGEVKKVDRASDGGAVIEFEVDDDYAPIPRDTAARVGERTVVGENYLELQLGMTTTDDLPSGDTLPMSQAQESVQVDEILSVLDAETRQRARKLIRGLGRGLAGRGEKFNEAGNALNNAVAAGGPVLDVLAHDRRQLARLFDRFGAVARSVGERGGAIRVLAREGRVTAESLADRDGAVRAMLEQMPPTLAQVRQTTGMLRGVTRTTTPVLSELAHAVRELRPVVSTLAPAAREGRSVMRELKGAAPRLEQVLGKLRALSGPGSTAMPQLRATLCQLNPLVKYLSPYHREIAAFMGTYASVVSWYDANGHAEREYPLFDESSLVVYDKSTADLAKRLMDVGVLGKIQQKGYNAYPKPGTLTTPAGQRVGLGDAGPADSKEPYERVQAEC
jgi:phospholipid/cholesterol/gamma-HCH transport system substrate-binding protein